MYMGSVGVVGDGEQMSLGDGGLRHEVAVVKRRCSFRGGRPVVEADAEVLAGGCAEGERAAGAELVLAGGDGGHGLGPGGRGLRHLVDRSGAIRQQISPLRFAPVEMTSLKA